MSVGARYTHYSPKSTEVYSYDSEDEAMRSAEEESAQDDVSVYTVFRIEEDGTNKPIAFFWHGEKYPAFRKQIDTEHLMDAWRRQVATQQSFIIYLTKEQAEQLQAFGDEHDVAGVSEIISAILDELVRLHDALWDAQFARSTAPLDEMARQAHEDHQAGLTEDFDPDVMDADPQIQTDMDKRLTTKVSNYLAIGATVMIAYPDGDVAIHAPGKPVKIISYHDFDNPNKAPSDRDITRKALLDAGVLSTNLGIPSDVQPISEEELEELGQLPEGARGSEELVYEDRRDASDPIDNEALKRGVLRIFVAEVDAKFWIETNPIDDKSVMFAHFTVVGDLPSNLQHRKHYTLKVYENLD